MDRPQIENAPGIVWRARKSGWVAEWHARTDLVRRGYRPPTARLWAGEQEPTEQDRTYISDQCQRLQAEMLVWGRGGIPTTLPYDGTLAGLIRCYQTDADSRYRTVRYRTRETYDCLMRRLVHDHGAEPIEDIKARSLLAWHREWVAGGHIPMAHSLMGMLRSLMSFGGTILECEECGRLGAALHELRFASAKPRSARLTAEQATALRAMAHANGLHSIALAQAFQFELMLRQKDVIGEWLPLTEEGLSDVVSGNAKWLRGLRWSEIDRDMILRHTTSKRGKAIEVNLRLAPMVMEELGIGVIPAGSSPVIISEANSLPYTAHEFRRQWRKLADACGIPRNVYNMDSRAGAITEATDAGAELEHIRHAATHSNISMTMRYSRGETEKTAGVMRQRVAYRNKSGTK